MDNLYQQRAPAYTVILPVFKYAMEGLLTPAAQYPDAVMPVSRWIGELPGSVFGLKVSTYDLLPWAALNDLLALWFGARERMRQHCRPGDLSYTIDTAGDERIGHASWTGEVLTLKHPRGIGKPYVFTDAQLSHVGLVMAIQRGWLPDSPNTFMQIEYDIAQINPRIPRQG